MPDAPVRSATGLVVAGMLVIAAASIMLASFQYVLVAMQKELGFSTDAANALAFMPSAASLLVVFVAGTFADRWGPRRLLVLATSLFIFGAVLVTLAPGMAWVVVGRVFDGIGGVTMAIVGLSVINSSVTDREQRARVFGIYGAVTPATFMIAPPVAALLVQAGGWRIGLLPGILIALGGLVMSLRYVPAASERRTGELLTPMLAGLVLAGLAMGVTSLSGNRTLGVIAFAIGAAALIVLIALMRRLASPTLDFTWCRGRGMFVLLVALAVAAMPNMFFYTNLLLQYRYSEPLISIALLLLVPQACAVGGALLSGPVSARLGAGPAATLALFACALLSLSTLFVTSAAPIWVPVMALALSAAPISFVVGPMTDSLLSRAPAGASGAGSSMRKATWTLGNVLGGALIGAVSFGAFQTKLGEILNVNGMALTEAQTIAKEIRDGAIVDELAVRLSDPIARDALIARGPGLLEAQAYAFTVMGVVSALIYLAAGLLMVAYLRRFPGAARV